MKKLKMVLGYFFYSGRIETCRIRELYETAIKKVNDTGFRVIFTVCDQEGVHRSLFQTLGMTQKHPSFEVNGERVQHQNWGGSNFMESC